MFDEILGPEKSYRPVKGNPKPIIEDEASYTTAGGIATVSENSKPFTKRPWTPTNSASTSGNTMPPDFMDKLREIINKIGD